MRVGMVAEATCISKPMTIIPMVVTEVQDLIASGQVQASDQLIDAQRCDRSREQSRCFWSRSSKAASRAWRPGSHCIANAYTSNHDLLDDPNISTPKWFFLHMVDAVGVVHALILRIQALLLPVQTLVLGGH